MSEVLPPSERPTVLVVDDEEDLRDIMRRMLERRGFNAIVAGDSVQAIATCREYPGDIDVLVTDLGLPAMRVVYISGLPKDIAISKGLIDADALLVKKPFTSELLIGALNTVLSEKATPTT
jgi:ActR/RegA family two-component response regulator